MERRSYLRAWVNSGKTMVRASVALVFTVPMVQVFINTGSGSAGFDPMPIALADGVALRRQLTDDLLDLARIDVASAADDDVLAAVLEPEEAAGPEHTDIPGVQPAVHNRRQVHIDDVSRFELPIVNTNRTVGTMLSHELVKKHGFSAYDYHE